MHGVMGKRCLTLVALQSGGQNQFGNCFALRSASHEICGERNAET